MSGTSSRVDTRAIVECLIAAHYSDGEILDYLTSVLVMAEADAFAVLEAVRGSIRIR